MAIDVFLGTPDRTIVDAALAIASLSNIESAEQVDKLLSPVAKLYADGESGHPRWNPASSVPFTAILADHTEWRGWLEQIQAGRRLDEKAYIALRNGLGAVKATPVLGPNIRGNLQVAWRTWMTGFKATYTYAAALILDPRNKLLNRIGKCGYAGCGRYFVDWVAIRSHTRPRKGYCCDKHEEAQHSRRTRAKKTQYNKEANRMRASSK